METKTILHVSCIIISAVFLFSSSCDKDTVPAIEEHDGAELTSIMSSTKKAVETGDENTFISLFLTNRSSSAGRSWKDMSEKNRHGSGYPLFLVTRYPELRRRTASAHVKKLVAEAWFDYRREYGSDEHIYRTLWAFGRDTETGRWKLENFSTRRSAARYRQSAYGPFFTDAVISELAQMDTSAFLSLNMNWENSVDPGPLISKTLQALIDNDIEKLKTYTVDGALFHAYGSGAEFSSVINDDSSDGKYNRDLALSDLVSLSENIRLGADEMGIDPKGLAPFFTAYQITSMPENCTRLKLSIEFETDPESLKLAGFVLSWTAARLKGKWLIESLVVKEYSEWEYRIEYNTE